MRFETKPRVTWLKLIPAILAVGVLLVVVLGDQTCSLNLRDAETKRFVADPNVTLAPELTQTAGPGTGGGGALLCEVRLPRRVVVTAGAPGYRDKTIKLLLLPGRSYDIFLEKQ